MASHPHQPLLVIGAGVMRTGTFSLRLALERLLDGKCYHMHYVQNDPEAIDFWERACSSDPSDDVWRDRFQDFRAAIDFPVASFYQRLMELYPDAKVILTTRDAHSWAHSVLNTVAASLKARSQTEPAEDDPTRRFGPMVTKVIYRALGEVNLQDEEEMVSAFQRRNEAVLKSVPKEKLLVFEAKEGWEPLCRFLGLPIPDEPYPLTNTTEEFKKLFPFQRKDT